MFYRINDKMFNENLATLKSPDRQAKCMRIQFEIKEKLPDIISEILHSDKWLTLVRDENHGLRRLKIPTLIQRHASISGSMRFM